MAEQRSYRMVGTRLLADGCSLYNVPLYGMETHASGTIPLYGSDSHLQAVDRLPLTIMETAPANYVPVYGVDNQLHPTAFVGPTSMGSGFPLNFYGPYSSSMSVVMGTGYNYQWNTLQFVTPQNTWYNIVSLVPDAANPRVGGSLRVLATCGLHSPTSTASCAIRFLSRYNFDGTHFWTTATAPTELLLDYDAPIMTDVDMRMAANADTTLGYLQVHGLGNGVDETAYWMLTYEHQSMAL